MLEKNEKIERYVAAKGIYSHLLVDRVRYIGNYVLMKSDLKSGMYTKFNYMLLFL